MTKTFSQFTEASAPKFDFYIDDSYSRWPSAPINFGIRMHHMPVAVIGSSNRKIDSMILFEPMKQDIRGANLRRDEYIYRYATEQSIVTEYFPFIKINWKKGYMYFLTKESFSGETDNILFDKAGFKIGYVRVIVNNSAHEDIIKSDII